MNAVIYARYSSDSQREESIEGQLRECKEYAQQNNITILGEYIDRALSAKTDNRPEFQRMIKDSYTKIFDTVLVWKLDRFARNRYDSAHYKNILKKNGVKVISAKETLGAGAESIILESMLEGYAEYYSVELAEKINRGLKENALKGKINGGTITLGYKLTKDQKYIIDEELAPIVQEIFTRYADGETMIAIANEINRRGFRSAYGNGISFNVIHHMLKNRRYLGEYKYRDIVHKGTIPAIISEDLFNRVQERMLKNQKAPARNKAKADYILTTKLKCGHCGTLMAGESGTSRHGNTHYYYKCGSAKRKQGCKKRAVKKEWIENLVIQYVMKIVLDDDLIEKIADNILELLSTESSKIPQLKARLKETNRGIDNLLNAIQQGIFTPSTKQRLEELEELKKDIETAIMCENLQRPEITKPHIIYYIKNFRNMNLDDLASKKRLIDSFVNSIFLYDDKIVFSFNYNDSTHELRIKDMEEELGSNLEGNAPPRKGRFENRPFFVCGISVRRSAELSAVRARSIRSAERISSVILTVRRCSRRRRESAYSRKKTSARRNAVNCFCLIFYFIHDIIFLRYIMNFVVYNQSIKQNNFLLGYIFNTLKENLSFIYGENMINAESCQNWINNNLLNTDIYWRIVIAYDEDNPCGFLIYTIQDNCFIVNDIEINKEYRINPILLRGLFFNAFLIEKGKWNRIKGYINHKNTLLKKEFFKISN